MPPLSTDPAPIIGLAATDAAPPSPPARPRGRLGWLAHLCILTAYIAVLTVLANRRALAAPGHPAIGSAAGVLWQVGAGGLLFALVCLAAWACSRASAADWRLRWRGGAGPLWLGSLYSVGMRLALTAATVAATVAIYAFHLVDPKTMEAFRPQVENAVSLRALAGQPTFFWLVVTLLSGFAGATEEIWRGGMLAGLAGVFPGVFGGRRGPWLAILPVAVLFGLGHLYMGWPAVVAALLLGGMLGAIMVWHRSLWYAAVAHALFDATSFAVLAWAARHGYLVGNP